MSIFGSFEDGQKFSFGHLQRSRRIQTCVAQAPPPVVGTNQPQGRHKLAHGVSRGSCGKTEKAPGGATRILPDRQWGFCSLKSQRLKPESNQTRNGTTKSRALIRTGAASPEDGQMHLNWPSSGVLAIFRDRGQNCQNEPS